VEGRVGDWEIVIDRPIFIAPAIVEEILAHAREEAPRECCGLLIGGDGTVERAVRARNLDEAPTRRYLIDPADHFRAIRAARAQRKDVIGAYHSHPSGPAVPSPTDLAEANNGSDFVYVIVWPGHGDVCAYRYEPDGFVSCPLTLIP
jgi:proteasome lid subunit RPN8/RPN11